MDANLSYEWLQDEMELTYHLATVWMEDDDLAKKARLEGGWTQNLDTPGGIEPHALQNL